MFNFVFLMFILPLLVLIGLYLEENHVSFVDQALMSLSVSIMASGIVYWLIDKKLDELKGIKDEITITLTAQDNRVINCAPMSRKDFSRAEVLGYIGMIPTKNKAERFSIEATTDRQFVVSIRKMQLTKGNQSFFIYCTNEEMEQFSADFIQKV